MLNSRRNNTDLKVELLARPDTNEDLKKIQTRIDELNFALGYEYQVVTIKNVLPLENASLNTIYVQSSGFHQVMRTSAVPESLESSSVLYLQLADDEESIVIYTDSDFDDDVSSGLTTLNVGNCSDLSSIIKLLPDAGQASFNPTLLQKLHDAFRFAEAPSNNILICSVKHFDGSYKTICVTAKDLNMEDIDDEFEINDQNKKIIVDKMVAEGYANRGLTEFNNVKILPDDYKAAERIHSYRLLLASLVMEIGYTYIQFVSTYYGLLPLVGVAEIAYILSLIGTGFDFGNNIWGVLVDNDAIALAVRELNVMTPAMSRIASLVNIANYISFLAGGAGNGLGILALGVDPLLYSRSLPAFYVAAAIVVALTSYFGKEYYFAFNIKRLIDSLNDFSKYLFAEKADHDAFYERDIAIGISALLVIVFRAVGFGGLAVLVAQALYIKNDWANLIIGATVIFATTISILATRIRVVVNYWSNNQFAYLTNSEKQHAWNEFTYGKITQTLMTSTTLEYMIMTIGLLCLTEFKNSVASYVAAGVGLALTVLMCRAQILREINLAALNQLLRDGIDVTNRNATVTAVINPIHDVTVNGVNGRIEETKNDETSDIEAHDIVPANSIDNADETIKARIKAVDLIFATMRKPYLESASLFSVTAVAMLFVGMSVLTRGLGFLGYVDILNNILKPIVTLVLDNFWQSVGIGLIFAPSNVRNLFIMFYENMSGNIAQKIIEAKIDLYNQEGVTNLSCVQWMRFVNPIASSGYRRDVSEVKKAVEKEVLILQSQLSPQSQQDGQQEAAAPASSLCCFWGSRQGQEETRKSSVEHVYL